MPLNSFPVLPGLGWSVTKTPAWKTRLQKSVSGRERRAQDQALPIWTWTLTYNFLRDEAAAGYNELRELMGFHAQQAGAFTPFLYTDPTDNSVTGQYLGTGNASQTQFQLVRNLDSALPGGGYAEPITNPVSVGPVYVNGVQTTGNSFSTTTGILTMGVAPANGAVVTADFTYAFQVRFSDDTADFENFMFQLWRLRQVKLVSVLL